MCATFKCASLDLNNIVWYDDNAADVCPGFVALAMPAPVCDLVTSELACIYEQSRRTYMYYVCVSHL